MNQIFHWLADVLRSAKVWALILPWERGVRIRAGKHTRLLEPGLHPRIPFIDVVRVVNTRLRIVPSPTQTITTSDGKAVTLSTSMGFRITSPLDALLAFRSPETWCEAYVQTILAGHIQQTSAANLSGQQLEQLMLAGLRGAAPKGLEFEWARVTGFAIVRTYRLLQGREYQPRTDHDEGFSA